MKMRRLPLLALLLAGLCLAAPGKAAEGSHFLWKATGGKGTVYLLGTVHVGTADLYPLAPVIEDSFKRSDALVEEIAPQAPADVQRIAARLATDGLYPAGQAIADHISAATGARLAEFAKANGLGGDYVRVRPWLLSLTIAQMQTKRLGFDRERGLDRHFLEEAKEAKKPVEALETAASQIELFSSLSDKLQDQLLTATLLDADEAAANFRAILGAWRRGSADEMQAVVGKSLRDHPFLQPFMDKVLYARNDAMAKKIEAMLAAPKTWFVAVGAAHLVGPRGILEQLRGKGYRVEQL